MTQAEGVKKLLTEKCEACSDCFTTIRGLNVHQRQHCDLFKRMDKSEYEVEKVLAARGLAERRFYLLKYKGLGQNTTSGSRTNGARAQPR